MLLFFVGRSSEDGTIAPGAAHRRLLLRECPALGHQHLHILATRITRKNVTCLEQQIRDIEQKASRRCHVTSFLLHSADYRTLRKTTLEPENDDFQKIPVASAFMPVFSDPKANLESRVRAVLDLVDSKREGMQ